MVKPPCDQDGGHLSSQKRWTFIHCWNIGPPFRPDIEHANGANCLQNPFLPPFCPINLDPTGHPSFSIHPFLTTPLPNNLNSSPNPVPNPIPNPKSKPIPYLNSYPNLFYWLQFLCFFFASLVVLLWLTMISEANVDDSSRIKHIPHSVGGKQPAPTAGCIHCGWRHRWPSGARLRHRPPSQVRPRLCGCNSGRRGRRRASHEL